MEEVRGTRPPAPREDGRPGARVPRESDRLEATRADEEVQSVGRAQVRHRARPLSGQGGEAFLKILESAVANAEFTGKEDPDAMIIRVINAHKGATTKGYRPRAYGRSGPWNQDTVNLEIVLEEVT